MWRVVEEGLCLRMGDTRFCLGLTFLAGLFLLTAYITAAPARFYCCTAVCCRIGPLQELLLLL